MQRELASASAWLGQDREPLLPWLELLGYRRRSDPEQIAADYERLFGKGIERVSSFESTYRWRDAATLLEESGGLNRDLGRMYGQYGLAPVEGMQDHVAVELEFLSYLCWRESERWGALSPASARELRQQEHNFLDEHLGRWFPELSLRVRQRADESLYGVFCSLTEAWLALELGSGYMGTR
jgi:TorA maturation chaperone TorD